jgi:acyl dehydratase
LSNLVALPVPFPEVADQILRAYAEASGDSNPIHLDADAAKRVGLTGVIAHGMLVAGWMGERAMRFISEQAPEMRLVEFSTRFRAMVFPGDVISVGGTAKVVDGGLLLDLVAKNQKGETTTTGSARFSS